MAFKKTKKNRYKRTAKPAGKKESVAGRQRMRMLIKIVFFTLLIACMALVFIFVHDFITQSDYFRADAISVEGCERLTEQEVLATAKIKEGDNFVSMNLKAIQKKLLAHPWIETAEIARTPSGVISIRIREQTPLAVVDFGKRFLINTEGVIFKEATEAETVGMTVISGIGYSDWKAPETPSAPFLSSTLAVLKASARPDGVLSNGVLKHILIDKEMGLTLKIEGPVRMLKLGYGDYDIKYSRLGKIVSHLTADETIGYIENMDMRNPDSVVAKPGVEPEEDPEKHKKEV